MGLLLFVEEVLLLNLYEVINVRLGASIYVQVGFRKLKGVLLEQQGEKYIVELEDKSRVTVDPEQIVK